MSIRILRRIAASRVSFAPRLVLEISTSCTSVPIQRKQTSHWLDDRTLRTHRLAQVQACFGKARDRRCIRHGGCRVEQGWAKRFDGLAERLHPGVTRNHPDVEMVACVLIVEIVRVPRAQDAILCTTQLLKKGEQLQCFGRPHFVEANKVPASCNNDQPGNGISNILVGMECRCLGDQSTHCFLPTRNDGATETSV